MHNGSSGRSSAFAPPTALWAFPPVALLASINPFGSTISFALFPPLPPPLPLSPFLSPFLPPLLPPAKAPSCPCPYLTDPIAPFPPTLSPLICCGYCCCSAPIIDQSFSINVSNGSLIPFTPPALPLVLYRSLEQALYQRFEGYST